MIPAYIGLVMSFDAASSETTSTGASASASFSGPGVVVFLLFWLAAVVFSIWNQIFRQGRTGYSIGKGVVGIKLVDEATGQPLGAGKTFVRQLCHVLEFGIGWLWPLWDAKRQTFADKIMKTLVVEAPKP